MKDLIRLELLSVGDGFITEGGTVGTVEGDPERGWIQVSINS